MSDCACEIEIKNWEEGRVLIVLLAINATMFLIDRFFIVDRVIRKLVLKNRKLFKK